MQMECLRLPFVLEDEILPGKVVIKTYNKQSLTEY